LLPYRALELRCCPLDLVRISAARRFGQTLPGPAPIRRVTTALGQIAVDQIERIAERVDAQSTSRYANLAGKLET
jgi:hypothetical protein